MDESSNIYSLFLSGLTVYTLWQLRQNWSFFWDAKVTEEDRDLATKVALFILIPIGVLFHEIGHSLATWQVGGEVEVFRWYLFSGYIIPEGDFSPVQDWWIFFAGNLVSILLGICAIPLIFRVRQRIVAEVLYKFAIAQSIYALIYYPLSSTYYRDGDWVVIYDLVTYPYAALLLIAHLILLWKLWQLYNGKTILQWRLARNLGNLEGYQKLQHKQLKRPTDLQPKIDLVYFLLEHDEFKQAKKKFAEISKNHSHSPAIAILKLYLDSQGASYDPLKYVAIIKSAEKLLCQDLEEKNRVLVCRLLAATLYRAGELVKALEYANFGLAIAPNNYMLLHIRARINCKSQQYDQAIADCDLALTTVVNEDLRQDILQLKKQCLNRLN